MPRLAKNLSDKTNTRIKSLPQSKIDAFANEIAQIPDIVKLTIGEPDLETPEHIKQAAIADIKRNDSHYAPEAGKPELLNAISNYLNNKLGVRYDPQSEICATVGVSEALNLTFMTLLNPGDKVLVPTPVWGVYFGIIELAGGIPIEIDTSDDHFLLTASKLEQTLAGEGGGAKALILTDPSNPTGRVYTKTELIEIAQVISDHDLFAITDEIYAELIYGHKKHYSLTQIIPERTILLSGLSKSVAMTGWRIGYIAGPQEIMQMIIKINLYLVCSVTDNVQAAATEALTNGEQDYIAARAIYEKRLNILHTALVESGFTLAAPEGAFYIFAKIPKKFGTDDVKFATDLAHKAKVGVMPGSYFGAGGAGFVRLSYAASDTDIQKAAKRIKNYVKRLQ
ncbi:aminotransferase class I/II-fold pyridoxal phosphate-dependent enzyme [Lactobacillus sp. ESL0684]|uniref:pyridoxal phosphate-dependent aminotransferase n=1 Tax=Lactobacillus sp. ESL0684 TaxID=2983213 RepID=UPI0023F98F30|nr:aminotransferase class I/II-fold pyridoxal phosphate-dependent enzyme [Lactobacillus sp. ESL0684]WEV44436.1 aminotransferase class I/II-fold pyridoxal phosphate-dependent enzyme [Lactobacillus sp. ESL0684]